MHSTRGDEQRRTRRGVGPVEVLDDDEGRPRLLQRAEAIDEREPGGERARRRGCPELSERRIRHGGGELVDDRTDDDEPAGEVLGDARGEDRSASPASASTQTICVSAISAATAQASMTASSSVRPTKAGRLGGASGTSSPVERRHARTAVGRTRR